MVRKLLGEKEEVFAASEKKILKLMRNDDDKS